MRRVAAALLGLTVLVAAPASAQERQLKSAAGTLVVEKVAGGLEHPWGLAFLPDGRMLVTERPGRLRILDRSGRASPPLQGVPEVFARGQGGLLDVALDPDFASNGLVYLSFAEAGEGGASTALGRGRLRGERIEGFEVIFRQQPKVSGAYHFGGRIVFAPDGTLFLTLGERFKGEPAQDLSDHLGTIVRLNPDGSVPKDNPFVGRPKAEDEIWSYGHRNIESGAIHPATKELWIAEMGPRGGDELNRPEAGRNYGWPLVSWGEHYDGRDIPDPPTRPEFADAAKHWTPVISPSGMVFYTGDAFPAWHGSMLIGGLTAKGIVRVAIDGRNAREEERIELGARIRDVEQGPDGLVYVLTDQADGNVWRLRPASQRSGR
jgi:glucose/arabinose dehydrogenase